ncbi:MAG: polyprenyl synthetase family protein [Desulfobacteraceae bacterium]|nr:polyprenyl synthetase family protein [Desulfobacteraceae bacterium]MCF8096114.1 polyprenyl synthetase family protein [Desulfobacteraceae bacterium]
MTGLKKKLLRRIDPDLEAVESALVENLSPHLELVRQAAGHLIFSGGKRLRPLLTVLATRICGHESPFIPKFASAFEFIHTATLLHDDVIDGASMRRGKAVAHSIYGTPITILVGDFLLARASLIAAETENPGIIRVVSAMTEEMSQGEIHQLIKKGDIHITENEYMEIIRCKTGILIEGACRTGAMLADAPEEKENALTAYGKHLGLVFQIADDILDYTADTSELGKTVGTDLKEGKLTLPLIHALNRARSADRRLMETVIANKNFTENDFKALLDLLEKYNGLDYAKTIAEDHLARAKKHLEIFAPSETRDILFTLADYALYRTS